MEETYNTKAIILNRAAFRECDTKVIIYTISRGKLELVARGTKKIQSRLASHLEPLTLSSVMLVKGRQYDYIGNAVSTNCYFNIKSDLEKLLVAGKAINIFSRLIKEEQPDKEIFILLENFLDVLNKARNEDRNYILLYSFFILKLLNLLGYRPELYNCLVCKSKIKPDGNKFNYKKGGIICNRCKEEGLTILDNCVKVLRLTIQDNLNSLIKLNIDKKSENEFIKVINSFLDYNL